MRLTLGRFDPEKYDKFMQLVPPIVAAIRELPGFIDLEIGIDRATGRTLSLTTLDTLEHAQFSRQSLGPDEERFAALGWEAEPPQIYEAIT